MQPLYFEKRCSERVAHKVAAEIIVRSGERRVHYVVQVASLSAEGAGVSLLAAAETELALDSQLVLIFQIDGKAVEMPAVVVRYRSESRFIGLYDVGLRLRADLAPSRMRALYQAWVSRLLADQIEGATIYFELDEDTETAAPPGVVRGPDGGSG